MPPEVRAVLYKGPGVHGDFTTMIQRDKYKDTLFIISENLRDMFYSSEVGGGTAQLRLHCYGHHDPQDQRPRAAGIPTGWTSLGGFPRLNPKVKFAIDLAFERILIQLQTFDYQFILYSCDPDDHAMIGAGLFVESVGEDVLQYISDKIHELPGNLEQLRKGTEPLSIDAYVETQASIRKKEKLWLGDEALLRMQNARMKAFITNNKLHERRADDPKAKRMRMCV